MAREDARRPSEPGGSTTTRLSPGEVGLWPHRNPKTGKTEFLELPGNPTVEQSSRFLDEIERRAKHDELKRKQPGAYANPNQKSVKPEGGGMASALGLSAGAVAGAGIGSKAGKGGLAPYSPTTGVLRGPKGWRYDLDNKVAIAPDGSRYPWNRPGVPTDADLDQLIAFHESPEGQNSPDRILAVLKGKQSRGEKLEFEVTNGLGRTVAMEWQRKGLPTLEQMQRAVDWARNQSGQGDGQGFDARHFNKAKDPHTGRAVKFQTAGPDPTEQELDDIFETLDAENAASGLSEPDRRRLDGIVEKMIANGESENDIQWVVDDFKKKYGGKPADRSLQGSNGSAGKGSVLRDDLSRKTGGRYTVTFTDPATGEKKTASFASKPTPRQINIAGRRLYGKRWGDQSLSAPVSSKQLASGGASSGDPFGKLGIAIFGTKTPDVSNLPTSRDIAGRRPSITYRVDETPTSAVSKAGDRSLQALANRVREIQGGAPASGASAPVHDALRANPKTVEAAMAEADLRFAGTKGWKEGGRAAFKRELEHYAANVSKGSRIQVSRGNMTLYDAFMKDMPGAHRRASDEADVQALRGKGQELATKAANISSAITKVPGEVTRPVANVALGIADPFTYRDQFEMAGSDPVKFAREVRQSYMALFDSNAAVEERVASALNWALTVAPAMPRALRTMRGSLDMPGLKSLRRADMEAAAILKGNPKAVEGLEFDLAPSVRPGFRDKAPHEQTLTEYRATVMERDRMNLEGEIELVRAEIPKVGKAEGRRLGFAIGKARKDLLDFGRSQNFLDESAKKHAAAIAQARSRGAKIDADVMESNPAISPVEAAKPQTVATAAKQLVDEADLYDPYNEASAPPRTAKAVTADELPKDVPKDIGPDMLSDVEALRRAAAVKGGGLASKKSGAAQMPDPVDTIRGIADEIKGVVDEAGGLTSKLGMSKVAKTIKESTTRFFGNTFDRLSILGPGGRALAKDLGNALGESEYQAARLGLRVQASVKANFGRMYGLSRKGRDSLGLNEKFNDIVTKVENREPLSKPEMGVWQEWVRVNGELQNLGKKYGVTVERMVSDHPKGLLNGKTIEWGHSRRGKVVGDDGNRLTVLDDDGEKVVLEPGTKFWSEQLADPQTFFPRELKREILDALTKPDSKEYKEAVAYLIEKGIAESNAEAGKVIRRILGVPEDVVIDTPVSSRLRRARTYARLPDHFYNRNFIEVAERHIARAALDIGVTKTFGPNLKRIGLYLNELPSEAHMREAKDLLYETLGSDPHSISARSHKGFASYEGSYQAITKMSSILTAMLQPTQLASSMGALGGKAGFRAVGQAIKSLVTDRHLIDEVKISGVIDQDVLSLAGIDDIGGKTRALATLATTPVRWMDRAVRVHAAIAGKGAVKDALGRLSLDKSGKLKRNASFRLLEDWFGYSESDIVRMSREGMTAEDLRKAAAGGVKTQVRTRQADVMAGPAFLDMRSPVGRVFWRFQTFTYGQTRIFGWAMKELSKGNAMPALRLGVAGALIGEGVLSARELYNAWTKHDEPERWRQLEKIAEKWRNGDEDALEATLGRAWENLVGAGLLGFYGMPADKRSKFEQSMFQPVVWDSLTNVVSAIAYGANSEKDFVVQLKNAGLDLAENEVVLWRQAYRRFIGEGKTHRQLFPLKKQDGDK